MDMFSLQQPGEKATYVKFSERKQDVQSPLHDILRRESSLCVFSEVGFEGVSAL